MLASSKCARYGSNLGTNHGPGRGEDEMGSAVVCPRGCRFCAVLWSENAANLPATNSALLVPIPREPLVPLVYFWSACMHPFVTALLGMSSLSQVDPLSLVVSQFASRRFYALTVRCPLHTLSLIRAFWGRFEKLAGASLKKRAVMRRARG